MTRPLLAAAALAAALAIVSAAYGAAPDEDFVRMHDQGAAALLASLPGYASLRERVRKLDEGSATVQSLQLEAGHLFYLKRFPGHAAFALCMRDGLAGAERVLVDSERVARLAPGAKIAWIRAAPDARHVAYGVDRGNDVVIKAIGVADARDLPFAPEGARAGRDVSWHPDGRSFYYARQGRMYRHVLGRVATSDEVVFAPGVGGARDVPDAARPRIVVPLESRHAYAIVHDGVAREIAVHITEQKDLAAARPRWRKIVAPADEVTAIEAWKDDLFLLSNRNAPHARVLLVNASRPDVARARVAIPEGDAVIRQMALARDALYLRSTVGGVDRLERLGLGILGTRAAEFVKTPFDMAVSEMVAHPRRPGILLRLEGWTTPPAVVEIDARSGDVRPTNLHPAPVADFAAMDEVRLYANTADGTRIPVTLVYRKDTKLTGANPMLLEVFGAYGESLRPRFDPRLLAWLERGGIYAFAHVRGGGEYGVRWHRAAQGRAKATSIDDFIAVADFVAKYGFTNPKRLAVVGTEAGSIAAGGALVRRPDLFAGLIASDALFDMTRHEQGPEGSARVPEFGSASRPGELAVLRDISAYGQVKEGAAYPAALFFVDAARDDVAQAASMAARLEAANPGNVVLVRLAPAQENEALADLYSFALWRFAEPEFQPRAKEDAK